MEFLSLAVCGVLICKIFVPMCNVPGCGGGGGVSGVGKVHRRLLHSGVRLPACCRPDERRGRNGKCGLNIEH